ncbi:hypothetical protein ENSA7_01170 [Enhygromyxa salina]|uniref:Uncharacterized protein n=2 Tax=Enhygromyxa salina TaxID=215803 RepID=A0A2S9YYJ4_9BACT|nr:hypothetical protein ENSA7_01170 [Enhygromyxa salina]
MLSYADLDLKVNEAMSEVGLASFFIVMESNEATVTLGGRWHPGYTPRFGQLSLSIKSAGVLLVGLGTLETASNFCDMGTGSITGEWRTYHSPSSYMEVGSGNWALSLGAFSSCEP